MRETLSTVVDDLRNRLLLEQQALLRLKHEVKSKEEGIAVVARALEQLERIVDKVPHAARIDAAGDAAEVPVTRIRGGERLLSSTVRNAERLAAHLAANGDAALSKLQSGNVLSYQSVRNIVKHFPDRFSIRRDPRGRELVHLLAAAESPAAPEPVSDARAEAEKLFSN